MKQLESINSDLFERFKKDEIFDLDRIKGGADCDTTVSSGGEITGYDQNVDGSTGSGADDDVEECKPDVA